MLKTNAKYKWADSHDLKCIAIYKHCCFKYATGCLKRPTYDAEEHALNHCATYITLHRGLSRRSHGIIKCRTMFRCAFKTSFFLC